MFDADQHKGQTGYPTELESAPPSYEADPAIMPLPPSAPVYYELSQVRGS